MINNPQTGMQIIEIRKDHLQVGFVLPGGTIVHDWDVRPEQSNPTDFLFIPEPRHSERVLYVRVEHEYAYRTVRGCSLMTEPLERFTRRVEELTVRRAQGWVPAWAIVPDHKMIDPTSPFVPSPNLEHPGRVE